MNFYVRLHILYCDTVVAIESSTFSNQLFLLQQIIIILNVSIENTKRFILGLERRHRRIDRRSIVGSSQKVARLRTAKERRGRAEAQDRVLFQGKDRFRSFIRRDNVRIRKVGTVFHDAARRQARSRRTSKENR